VQLYVLADKLQNYETNNIVIDALLTKMRKDKNSQGINVVNIMFSNTPESSPLRPLALDCYAAKTNERTLDLRKEEAHPEFLIQFCRKLLLRPRESMHNTFQTGNHTKYHVQVPDSTIVGPPEKSIEEI
jgi:hypothetical protein